MNKVAKQNINLTYEELYTICSAVWHWCQEESEIRGTIFDFLEAYDQLEEEN